MHCLLQSVDLIHSNINKIMKVIILLTFVFSVALTAQWAVLVAGSSTYSNYRHQADVFHAYQILVNNGFDQDKIITFAYNDIALSPTNPYKGKVFNKPTYQGPGVDVYDGVKIDYSGANVTPENFLAVLQGNSTQTKGLKVLELDPSDKVFVFFSDHGSPGLIAFPSKYLYADQLLQTFNKITGKFSKFVFYLETCESGSMFQKLPNNTGIYALSASNPTESSWGTYCSPDDVVQGKHIGSCLGDLFSVNFLEDIDSNKGDITLSDQFAVVKKLTSLSHVMQWGDLSFQSDKVADFVSGSRRTSNLRTIRPIQRVGQKRPSEAAKMNSRTMKLQSLSAIYARDHSADTFKEMMQEMASMEKYDLSFKRFDEKLTLTGVYDSADIKFDCLRAAIDNYEEKCGKFSDYGLQYIKNFAEACEKHETGTIIETLKC